MSPVNATIFIFFGLQNGQGYFLPKWEKKIIYHLQFALSFYGKKFAVISLSLADHLNKTLIKSFSLLAHIIWTVNISHESNIYHVGATARSVNAKYIVLIVAMATRTY